MRWRRYRRHPLAAFAPGRTGLALHGIGVGWYDRIEAFRWRGFRGPIGAGTSAHEMRVVYIESPALLESCETAIRFMEDYSRRPWQPPPGSPPGLRLTSDPMIFAEQRLLAMCAARAGMAVQPLARVHANCHLEKNPLCSHLWGSKAIYMRCGEARAAYANFLIRWLLDQHPEARSPWRDGAWTAHWGGRICDMRLGAWRSATRFHFDRRLNGVTWVRRECKHHRRRIADRMPVLRRRPGIF